MDKTKKIWIHFTLIKVLLQITITPCTIYTANFCQRSVESAPDWK